MAKKRAHLTSAHAFGGAWTQQKLDLLAKYLSAYTRILSKTPLNFAYIDAFAGTGSRSTTPDDDQADMFDAEAIQFAEGSARIALGNDPPFQKYIFIDNDKAKLGLLADVVRRDFPTRESHVTYCHGDANGELRRLCAMNWSAHRALLFLDPFGMQVEWETVAAIAQTKGIDLWVLFPIGVAVNRMLTRSGSMLPSWRQRLNRLFGTEEWEAAFYGPSQTASLFEGEVQREKVATLTSIVEYYQLRLRSIFAGVADSPALLCNSKGNPLYALCLPLPTRRVPERR